MIKKLITSFGISIVSITVVSTSASAEWIKDQQNKWIYYENNSVIRDYKDQKNAVEPMEFSQYYQADARWGNKRYGLSNLRITGCVPTSLAMIISAIKEEVTPVQVADYIYSTTMEMNTTFTGTSSLGAKEAIVHWGLNYRVINSKNELVAALKSGKIVYGAVGHGIFVNGYSTHAIILSGYHNGNTKAIDPDNMYKTNKWYSVEDIWNERSLGPEDTAIGGAFMAIYK
ncbi:C39 family peptidase [Gemella cuniculi]|uniref:C39 family peptidase n=1 Tax=Gemella cuniculi TaxID=150240 RepID=UPI00040DFD90|nr:C39 family peptidase [Gemella cuniculi]